MVRCRCKCCRKVFMGINGAVKWCELKECQEHKEKYQKEQIRLHNKRNNKPERSKDVISNFIKRGSLKKYRCQNNDCGRMSFNRFFCPSCTSCKLTRYTSINGVIPV